jgi:hypothetical protein
MPCHSKEIAGIVKAESLKYDRHTREKNKYEAVLGAVRMKLNELRKVDLIKSFDTFLATLKPGYVMHTELETEIKALEYRLNKIYEAAGHQSVIPEASLFLPPT